MTKDRDLHGRWQLLQELSGCCLAWSRRPALSLIGAEAGPDSGGDPDPEFSERLHCAPSEALPAMPTHSRSSARPRGSN